MQKFSMLKQVVYIVTVGSKGLLKHHTMETCYGSGGTYPRILSRETRWMWVVNFRLRSERCLEEDILLLLMQN
jgi:hypothetical protein